MEFDSTKNSSATLAFIMSLFVFILAMVIVTALTPVGAIAGKYIYAQLLANKIIANKNIVDESYVISNTIIIITSIALVVLPIIDRRWLVAPKAQPSARATARSLISYCVLIMCYQILVILFIKIINPGTGAAALQGSFWLKSFFSLAFMFAAPLAEEIYFRGWAWERLDDLSSKKVAAILTALIWLALHLPNIIHILALCPLAYFLTRLRLSSKNFLFPFILHAFNNCLLMAIYLLPK